MSGRDLSGEEFAKVFSEFSNNMNDSAKKEAIEKMMRDHRTLQQNMMRFCMEFIEAMSNQQYDLRNEASVKLAKEIMEIDSVDRILPKV